MHGEKRNAGLQPESTDKETTMLEATVSEGKIYVERPNRLQKYVEDCINDAVDRVKNHPIVEENPLEYVIKTIIGYDEPYDPKSQPYARYAKDNLADTDTALNFIKEYYDDFKETVDYMADQIGKRDFYSCIFKEDFDLVNLTVAVYTDITHTMGISAEIVE